MSVVRTIPRHCVKAVGDILTGLDDGARWLNDRVGPFGLLCALASIGLLAVIAMKTGG